MDKKIYVTTEFNFKCEQDDYYVENLSEYIQCDGFN